jgi:NAD(P)-dependent dehydrogenase (short-subunit alcohol dehydrogenase family)
MDSRVSVVTGGASGIGLAVARRLTSHGPVIVADLDQAALETAADEGMTPYRMDVSDAEAWAALATYIGEKHGRLDALVHNAAICPLAPLTGTTNDQFAATYATNVGSVLIGTRELWDLLTASRGSIVNVASVAALVGQDRSAAYVASKGAVLALTRALALELAPFGVRVNSVCPGTTMTPLLERHFKSIPGGDEAQAHLTRRHPLGRLLTPEDIAPSIVHLLFEETAGAMTGSNIVIDGGLTASFDYGNSFSGGGSDAG